MRFAIVVVSSMLVATGCSAGGGTGGDSASSGSCADLPAGPIRLGSVLPLSGPFAALGATNDSATAIAVDAFNENDSICGRPVEVVREDDKGDPAVAVTRGRKLIADGIRIFINAGRGETSQTLIPLLMKDGIINISDSGSGARYDVSKFPTQFGVDPTNPQYMLALADHIKRRGWTKVGILSDGLTGGTEYVDVLSDLLDKAGNPVVKVVKYSPTAIDLSSPLRELQSAGVETLVLAGTSNIVNYVAALRTSGWKPNLASWGGLLAYGIKAADLPEGTTDLCYTSLPGDQSPDGTAGLSPITLGLLNRAAAQLGEYNPAANVSHEAYTRLLVAKAAIEKAGSLDLRALKKAMESLNNLPTAWPGIALSYSPDNHAGFPQDRITVCGLQTSRLAIRYQAAS